MIKPLTIVTVSRQIDNNSVGVIFSSIPADKIIGQAWYGVAFPDQDGHLKAIRSFQETEVSEIAKGFETPEILELQANLSKALFDLDLERPI